MPPLWGWANGDRFLFLPGAYALVITHISSDVDHRFS